MYAEADVLVVQTPPEAMLFGAAELVQLKAGARVVSPCSPARSTTPRSHALSRGPSPPRR